MTNAQASDVGDGWATPADNYITQTFVPCADDPEGTAEAIDMSTEDMCYDGDVLTLSLNGSSTTIVDDDGTFKLQNDDGAVLTHVTDSDKGQGTYNTDYWKLTERDLATQLLLRPATTCRATPPSDSDARTRSTGMPVYSARTRAIPCYSSSGFTSSSCATWPTSGIWTTSPTRTTTRWPTTTRRPRTTMVRTTARPTSSTSPTPTWKRDRLRIHHARPRRLGTIPGPGALHTASTRCVSSTCATLSSSLSTPSTALSTVSTRTSRSILLCASGADLHGLRCRRSSPRCG